MAVPLGAIAALLRHAIVSSGVPADRVSVVRDELDATYAAIEMAAPGDLVVVLADSIDVVWGALRSEAARDTAPAFAETVAERVTPGASSRPLMRTVNGAVLGHAAMSRWAAPGRPGC